MRTHRLSVVLALSCAFALACGKDNGAEAPPDAGARAYGLALVGDAVLTLHPGDVRKLQVVLAQAEIGPISGTKVHFEFADGNPEGALLDSSDVTTGAGDADGGSGAGVALVTLTAGARTQFKILASVPSLPQVAPVGFSVAIVAVDRVLQIIGSPQVQVSLDRASAGVTMFISSSVGLKARLIDRATNQAIAGETLVFTLGPQSAGLRFSNNTTSATAVTSASGEAQVFVVSSNVTATGVQVTAASQSGGGAVT